MGSYSILLCFPSPQEGEGVESFAEVRVVSGEEVVVGVGERG